MLDRTTQQFAHDFHVLAWPAPATTQLNPYISLIYSQFKQAGIKVTPFQPMRLGRQTADVFHVHWPEAVLWGRLANSFPLLTRVIADLALKAMDEVRNNGGSIVWTVHNLVPHAIHSNHRAIWDDFFRSFLSRVDLLIGMTERSLDLACETYPELTSRPRIVIPHPHFRTAYPPPPDMEAARDKLGLPNDAFIVGMLGSIRASKGIPQAITAFREARIVNSILDMMDMLLVSGESADESGHQEIKRAIENDTGIVYRREALSSADLADSFAAVDAILINQRATLNSGTLLLALSMNRPVIAPASGSVGELAREFRQKWIFTFSGELTAKKLRDLIDQMKDITRPAIAPLEQYDPAKISRATIAALSYARAQRRPQALPYQFGSTRIEKVKAHGGSFGRR